MRTGVSVGNYGGDIASRHSMTEGELCDGTVKMMLVFNTTCETTVNQDEDILDTWFSTALWPFSTLGWPENTGELDLFPTYVLVTGYDIIFFWVARMIMMGLKFTGKIPFKEVYITWINP